MVGQRIIQQPNIIFPSQQFCLLAAWGSFLLLQLLLPPPAIGQLSAVQFEHVPFEEGLYQHSIKGITQDRQGYIWIAGVAHLFRYDGYSFLRIAMPRGDTLFTRWTKEGLAGGRNGILCLYGRNDDLLFYDTEKDSAWLLRLPVYRNVSDSILHVSTVLQDSKGRFWVGTTEGLLFSIGTHSAEIELSYPVEDSKDASPLGLITSIAEDSTGSVWIGGLKGLVRINAQAVQTGSHDWSRAFTAVAAIDSVGLIATGKDLKVWVVKIDRQFGWLDTRSGKISPCAHLPTVPAFPWLTSACVDRAGDVWIGAVGEGLFRWRCFAQRWDSYPHICGGPEESEPTDIRDLYVDRTGVLWVGTAWQGLLKHVPFRNKFNSCTPSSSIPGGLSASEVSAVRKDRLGTLWVGTWKNGLNYLEPGSKSFGHLKNDFQNPKSLGGNMVVCLLERRNGELWIGTAPGGINRYERRTHTFHRIQHHQGDPWGVDEDVVNALLEDREGTVWVGHPAGLDRYEERTGSFSPFLRWPKETVQRAGTVEYFCEDSRGNLWIATGRCGLLRLNRSSGDSVWYHYTPERAGSLPSNSVHCLAEDEEGRLWLGTAGGLARYDYETDGFQVYSIRSPHSLLRVPPGGSRYMASLPVGVAGIVPDFKGNLWLSSTVGIVKFRPSSGTYHVFSSEDGVAFTRGMRHAAFRTREGVIYLGGIGGYNWFHPDSMQDNPVEPPVVVTEFRVFQDTQWVPLVCRQEIRLEHWQDTFSFEFAALDYSAPQQNQFMYKFEGAETDWVSMGTDRRVSFANVSPGRYTLRVRGSNSDGIRNEAGIAIRIIISPPYWQTWWFRALVGLAVGLLVYAAFRYRLARLMAVEKLRLRIAQDLHDDIGSTLSGIALTSDTLARRLSNDPQAKRDLQELRQVAVEKAEHLQDLVWTINPKKDTSGDLRLHLKETAHRLLLGIDVQFTSNQEGPGGKMSLEVKHNITMIFREIVHNIVSHSRARRVQIEVTEKTGLLGFRVADDGVGFDPKTCSKGNGLVNLEQRAQAIGGRIKIESAPGAGTTVVFEVKIT